MIFNSNLSSGGEQNIPMKVLFCDIGVSKLNSAIS